MRQRITITDTGLGSWYGPKKFERRTIELDFTDRAQSTGVSFGRFDMVWHKIVDGRRVTTAKRFVTELDRQTWEKANLGGVEFEPLVPPVVVERGTPLTQLIGHRLVAVGFDDPTLELAVQPAGTSSPAHRLSITCDALVAIVTPEGVVTPDDFGYADTLVALRGEEVVTADEFTDTGLTLEMSNGVAVSITPHLGRDADTIASFPTSEGLAEWSHDSAAFSLLTGRD